MGNDKQNQKFKFIDKQRKVRGKYQPRFYGTHTLAVELDFLHSENL